MDENTRGMDRRLFGLVLLSTVFGLGHHVDHVIRGNHVGWPVTPEVNPFTYGLVIYPLVLIGLYLTATDRTGVRYWFVVALLGLGMLGGVHFGPWAIEPSHDIVGPYRPSILGYIALAWLLGLLGTLLVTAIYAAHRLRCPRPA